MTCRRAASAACALLAITVGSRASATPVVYYDAAALGGGLFSYVLTVDDDDGAEALSGLDVLHANSVFGVTPTSPVGQPSGWSHFAPLPPLLDDLDWFSLAAGGDVAVDGTMSGFSFVSATDPNSLDAGDFAVEGIGSDSASQIPLGDAERVVPEPATAALLGLALAALGARRRA